MTPLDDLLGRARARLHRVEAPDLAGAMAEGAVVVDIRPIDQRERDGELPGAIVIARNVLEWRMAPDSDWCEVDSSAGRQVILVCDEGYQSSLAAATLIDLGVEGATDLVGGYQAWMRLESSRRPGHLGF